MGGADACSPTAAQRVATRATRAYRSCRKVKGITLSEMVEPSRERPRRTVAAAAGGATQRTVVASITVAGTEPTLLKTHCSCGVCARLEPLMTTTCPPSTEDQTGSAESITGGRSESNDRKGFSEFMGAPKV
eukprot:6212549-Pleurochrysis_carterae.AAC.3